MGEKRGLEGKKRSETNIVTETGLGRNIIYSLRSTLEC